MLSSWQRSELGLAGARVSVVERPTAVAPREPALLLLHGLVAEAETFRRLLPELPVDRRIVALDLPGAGYSERPGQADSSFAGMAAVVLEGIAALGLRRPIILGHSHGGAVALKFAMLYPEHAEALILVAPAHPFSGHEDGLVRFYLSRPGRLFAHSLPWVPRRLYLAGFRKMPGSRRTFGYQEIEPYLHTLRAPGTIAHLLRLLSTWNRDMTELAAELRERPISVPTLLLWGDRDIVVPVSTAPRLLEHLTNAELVRLPGVGHLPNEEAPENCGRAIREWIERCGL